MSKYLQWWSIDKSIPSMFPQIPLSISMFQGLLSIWESKLVSMKFAREKGSDF